MNLYSFLKPKGDSEYICQHVFIWCVYCNIFGVSDILHFLKCMWGEGGGCLDARGTGIKLVTRWQILLKFLKFVQSRVVDAKFIASNAILIYYY